MGGDEISYEKVAEIKKEKVLFYERTNMNVCDTCEIAYISKERKYINDCPLCYAKKEIEELKEEIKTLKIDVENLEDELDKT